MTCRRDVSKIRNTSGIVSPPRYGVSVRGIDEDTNVRLLEQLTRKAVTQPGIPVNTEKINDADPILDMGGMMTPALAVDGEVKKVGRVPGKDQVIKILRGED